MAHGTTAWSNSVAGKVGHAGEIDKLLALEPGATLESISTWADEHRNPATAAWHYINFPKGTCSYAAARDFPDGNCVVAAIDKQLAVLGSDASADKRLTAFVGRRSEFACTVLMPERRTALLQLT